MLGCPAPPPAASRSSAVCTHTLNEAALCGGVHAHGHASAGGGGGGRRPRRRRVLGEGGVQEEAEEEWGEREGGSI